MFGCLAIHRHRDKEKLSVSLCRFSCAASWAVSVSFWRGFVVRYLTRGFWNDQRGLIYFFATGANMSSMNNHRIGGWDIEPATIVVAISIFAVVKRVHTVIKFAQPFGLFQWPW
jgi:hypothetical protein